MPEGITSNVRKQGGTVLGICLLVLGVAFLVMEVADVRLTGRFWGFIWPFFVIGPGVLLLFGGTKQGGTTAEASSIVGGIITMTGLALFYANTTGHWESMAYAWTMMAPGGVAVGQIVDGILNNKPETKSTGQKLMKISLIMLAVGAVFFEIVLDISGFFRSSGLKSIALPGILIGLGLLLLMNSLRGPKETPPVVVEAPPARK